MNPKNLTIKIQQIILDCAVKEIKSRKAIVKIKALIEDEIDLSEVEELPHVDYLIRKILTIAHPIIFNEFYSVDEGYMKGEFKLKAEEKINHFCYQLLHDLEIFETDEELKGTINKIIKLMPKDWLKAEKNPTM